MKTLLEQKLDEVLFANRSAKAGAVPQNAFVIGGPCTGKKSIIQKWAKENNINLVRISSHYAEPLRIDRNGILVKVTKPDGSELKVRLSDAFRALQNENTVLFLDKLTNFNTPPEERAVYYSILKERKYIDDHGTVLTGQGSLSHYISEYDDTVTEVKLPNLLFTVATGYPSTCSGTYPLTDKEKEMFGVIIPVSCNKNEFLAYITGRYDRIIKKLKKDGEKADIEEEQRTKDLLVKILTSDEFDFTDEDDGLNYYSLIMAAEFASGDEKEFIEAIKGYDVTAKSVEMLLRVLAK